MFEEFSQRAAEVKQLLAGSKTLFLAVATPQHLLMDEAVFLYKRLMSNRMPFGGFIINRVSLSPSKNDNERTDVKKLFSGINITSELKEKLITVHENFQKMAQSDARSIQNLKDKMSSKEDVLLIPCANGEIANLDDLYRLTKNFERCNQKSE
jgi:anion-transporting  ArsA/GET3 family ATPase